MSSTADICQISIWDPWSSSPTPFCSNLLVVWWTHVTKWHCCKEKNERNSGKFVQFHINGVELLLLLNLASLSNTFKKSQFICLLIHSHIHKTQFFFLWVPSIKVFRLQDEVHDISTSCKATTLFMSSSINVSFSGGSLGLLPVCTALIAPSQLAYEECTVFLWHW